MFNPKKMLLPVVVSLAMGGSALAQNLDTDAAKESYSVGASVGYYLSSTLYRQTELGAGVDMDLVVQGVTDALKNQSKLSEDDILKFLNERADRLNKLSEARLKQIREANSKLSADYLAANKAKAGVTTTASGLQYEVRAEGKGDTAREEDVVTLEYVGKFADGTEFEGTAAEKKTEKFVVMTMFPGLKEGVKLMREGAEYVFSVPAAIAYGEDGAGPVPPEMALVFDVKLVKIEKPGAHSVSKLPPKHPPVGGPDPGKAPGPGPKP